MMELQVYMTRSCERDVQHHNEVTTVFNLYYTVHKPLHQVIQCMWQCCLLFGGLEVRDYLRVGETWELARAKGPSYLSSTWPPSGKIQVDRWEADWAASFWFWELSHHNPPHVNTVYHNAQGPRANPPSASIVGNEMDCVSTAQPSSRPHHNLLYSTEESFLHQISLLKAGGGGVVDEGVRGVRQPWRHWRMPGRQSV